MEICRKNVFFRVILHITWVFEDSGKVFPSGGIVMRILKISFRDTVSSSSLEFSI